MTTALPTAAKSIRAPGPEAAPSWLRTFFSIASIAAPELCSALIARKLVTPRRRRARPLLAGMKCEMLEAASGRLCIYDYGSATRMALLVHGWEGQALDFASMSQDLAQAGFRTLAFDAPAHGRSAGRQTDVQDMARAVKDVIDHYGLPNALVAHSLGAAAVAVYLAELAPAQLPQRLVLLAPAGELREELAGIGRQLSLSERAQDCLRRRVERRYRRPLGECSTERALAGLRIPTLIVHDQRDRVVPVANAQRLVSTLREARLIRTQGLGHRGLLSDGTVIRQVLEFLDPDTSPCGQ